MNDVATEIRDILVFHLGADQRRLTDDARLAEDLGADSLDVVEIVMSCEERFAIEIPNRVATQLTTVGEAVRFVASRLLQRGRSAARAREPVGGCRLGWCGQHAPRQGRGRQALGRPVAASRRQGRNRASGWQGDDLRLAVRLDVRKPDGSRGRQLLANTISFAGGLIRTMRIA
jgi:acyl carrier protein